MIAFALSTEAYGQTKSADTSFLLLSAMNSVTISKSGNFFAVPFADITGWRYKAIDGKMYRRQYNYSKEKWIGEWELC